VVNKVILRTFKRYFVGIFSKIHAEINKRRNRHRQLVEATIQKAKQMGLINADDQEDEEYVDLVCWMGIAKNTKKVRKLFNSSNQSINLMEHVLTKYTHLCLENLFENNNIKRIFIHFLNNGREQAIKSFPADKKELYEETLRQLQTNFGI